MSDPSIVLINNLLSLTLKKKKTAKKEEKRKKKKKEAKLMNFCGFVGQSMCGNRLWCRLQLAVSLTSVRPVVVLHG